MLEFQEKRKVKKLIYSRLTLVILLAIIGFLFKGVWGVYQKQALTSENLKRTEADLKSLKERSDRLSSEIEWLKTEQGTDQEIRERYGLVKPGEEVIVIVDQDKNSTNFMLKVEEKSFWQKIMDMIN